jgi:transposase-like protein
LPDGAVPDNSGRWTPHRKAAVLKEIAAGELSVSEACARWELTLEELQSWNRDYRRYGLRGLKTTRVQAIREEEARSGLKSPKTRIFAGPS